jgi:hypothetical protein
MWHIINLTMDAHPIHVHLVQFQLFSRQNFDEMEYENNYMNTFTAGVNSSVMTGMYMGAEGPPSLYNEMNSDGAIGGNPSVTPFLVGPVLPAELNEKGWKDVIKVYPGQVTTFIVRFAPTDMPINTKKESLVYDFNPGEGPGYVWHCHILEHEDNDMMRPMNVQPNPSRIQPNSVKILPDFNPANAGGFALEQNIPNPFSTEAEIKFSIPDNMHVQLKLFNSLGAEVNTLIDADAKVGDQVLKLYAENLENGIYFYQLKAGSFMATKKMLILK